MQYQVRIEPMIIDAATPQLAAAAVLKRMATLNPLPASFHIRPLSGKRETTVSAYELRQLLRPTPRPEPARCSEHGAPDVGNHKHYECGCAITAMAPAKRGA